MVFKKGNKPWNTGIHLPKEIKDKISNSRKGKGIHSEEWKNNLSEKLKNDEKNTDLMRKNAEKMRGKPSWNAGLSKENNDSLKRISESNKGHTSWNKGKRPEYMIGNKNGEKLKGIPHSELHKKHIGEALKKSCKRRDFKRYQLIQKPSKPQIKLFNYIESKFPSEEVVMECSVKTSDGFRFIDVAIPSLKLGFEYDAPYWHQDVEKDQIRHRLIENEGWHLAHFSDEKAFV